MVDDSEEYKVNVYKIKTSPKLDKNKIFIIIIIILLFICICLTINYVQKTIASYKVYKQYEAQINSIKYQEEQKQLELEKKRQEKIPKLTEER